jgi:hypothetical protein
LNSKYETEEEGGGGGVDEEVEEEEERITLYIWLMEVEVRSVHEHLLL